MKIDFFRVGSDVADVRQTLRQIQTLTGSERTKDVGGIPLRMADSQSLHGAFVADLVRIEDDEIPPAVSRDGRKRVLDLRRDEGLARETACLYDHDLRIFVLQKNLRSIGASGLTTYMGHFGCELQLLPIPSENLLAQLQRSTSVRSVCVKLASPTSQRFAAEGDGGVSEAIDRVRDEFEALAVELRFSVGRVRNRSLARSRVMRLFRRLTEQPGVERLQAQVRDEDDHGQLIDLLNGRIRDEAEIELVHRVAPFESRATALYDALRRRRPEIARVISSQPE